MKKQNEYLKEWRKNHPENVLVYKLKRQTERQIQKEIQKIKDEEFNKRIVEYGIKFRNKYPQLFKNN